LNLIATDNKRVVVGLGITGMSCARFFARNNTSFSMVDSRESPPGLAQFREQFPDVPIELGPLKDDALLDAGQLVVSPGVSLEEPAVASAINQGVSVCGDIDLFRSHASAPIIAITGSNGKSTVTTLVGEMITQAGKKVAVGGNIGIPALDLLEADEPDYYVLELSSFQLERAGNLALDVATVLNISADHMDRYSSLMRYHQAKHRIFRGCKQVVVNRADALSQPLVAESVKISTFGLGKPDLNTFGLIEERGIEFLAFGFEQLMPVSELKIVGRHNIENALAALALGKAVGLPFAPMLDVLRAFTGLPHRCQFVAESEGVRYYNDSKGTNVGAAIAAVRGLAASANKIVLIAGGDAKGADFSPLLPVLEEHGRGAVLIGEAAQSLDTLLNNTVATVRASTMDDAVTESQAMADSGDAVLLSPACASFDMFDNYQHRGNVFAESVLRTVEQGGIQ
jgi:UDP-N-acetylmuramoylalanine--D-glutamate ligase